LNSNGFAVIRFSLKHDGVPWPPQKAAMQFKADAAWAIAFL
jgi:hypothetical protein